MAARSKLNLLDLDRENGVISCPLLDFPQPSISVRLIASQG
jgi:hypothetical protein